MRGSSCDSTSESRFLERDGARSSSPLVRSFLFLLVVGLLVVSTLGSSAAESSVDTKASKQKWLRLDLPHFTVISAASEERTRQIGRDLETLQAMLSLWLGGDEVHSPVETTIYVFASFRAFKPYKHEGAGAYFSARKSGNYVALTADPNYNATRFLYHEYFHYFAHNNLPEIPLWLNEGLAEFYSTFRVDGDQAQVGEAIKHHQQWLSRRPELPLSAFFELDKDSEEYNEGVRTGGFYAQSWGLVHYLMAGNQERSLQLMSFLEALAAGTEEEQAFARAFGADFQALEQELEVYLQKPMLPGFRLSIDGLKAAAPRAEVTRLTRAQVLIRLGSLLANVYPDRAAEARAHYLAALELDPGGEIESQVTELLERLEARAEDE